MGHKWDINGTTPGRFHPGVVGERISAVLRLYIRFPLVPLGVHPPNVLRYKSYNFDL